MMGASFHDTVIESLIRRIGTDFSPDPEMEWASKYGTNIENESLMMHRYCWCEEKDCPWCLTCYDSWEDDHDRDACDVCSGREYGADKGGEPEQGLAPNLWLKTTGLKVWWYKYIGRDMNFNREPTPDDVRAMLDLLDAV